MGDRLRAARERLGWTREELAVHAGISWSAIAQAETGRRRNLRSGTLSGLSRALGVSVDYLVTGGTTPPMLRHQALLYETDDAFAQGAGDFVLEGIDRSEATLVVTDSGNLELIRERLGSKAGRVEFRESTGQYTSPEAALDLFRAFLSAKIEQGAVWVRVVGEPIWAGRSKAEVRLWTRYESLINLVLGGSPMSLLCPYNATTLDPAIASHAHVTHPQIVEGGTVTDSPEYRDPGGFALEP
jgi:transcriptional regulator with XRE-family HTH domain